MNYCKLIILCFFCMPCFASEKGIDYFGGTFENDVFFDEEDDGYTNGFSFNWGYYDLPALDENSLPAWLLFLAEKSYINNFADRQYQVDYVFGQFMQTSNHIKIIKLIESDAPYVGLLAGKVNITAYNENITDDLSLILGIVGPLAAGEYIQKNFHSLIGAPEPVGWDNQINNEAVFRVEAERLWRHPIAKFKGIEMDLVTGLNTGIGNLLSDVNAGVGIRWGNELALNFSSSSPFLVQKLNGIKANPHGWYAFTSLSTSYVFNDIFIDGNTFEESHNVDLIHWQTAAAVGIQVNISNWNVVFTMLQATDQYESQSDKARWGNVTVTHHF